MAINIPKTYYLSRTNSPKCRSEKVGWLEIYQNQCNLSKKSNTEYLLIGDSIIKNLSYYPNIWQHYFTNGNYINCGISGDSTQHILMENKKYVTFIYN